MTKRISDGIEEFVIKVNAEKKNKEYIEGVLGIISLAIIKISLVDNSERVVDIIIEEMFKTITVDIWERLSV